MNLRQIIRAECACYFHEGHGGKDWCEPRDGACVAFGDFRRCRYFEECVLPAQPDASAEYAELVRSVTEQQKIASPTTSDSPGRRATRPLEALGPVKHVCQHVPAKIRQLSLV